MTWFEWSDLGEFVAWHNDAKAAAGIPKPGVNQATGELEINAQWTTQIAESVMFADGTVRALLPDDIDTSGLTPCDPPPEGQE